MVLDSLLQQLQAHNAVNVSAFLKHARTPPHHLVQTEVRGHAQPHCSTGEGGARVEAPPPAELTCPRSRAGERDASAANLRPLPQEQFVFIHDALAEAIVCGETEVAAEHLNRYVDELLVARQAGRTRLEKQFKVS